MEEGYQKISGTLAEMKIKVDDMHNRMTLGKGAFMFVVKLGAVVIGAIGLAKMLGISFWDWHS